MVASSANGVDVGPLEALLLEPLVEAELIGDPVYEQHPAEMVHFMLDATGQQTIGLEPLSQLAHYSFVL